MGAKSSPKHSIQRRFANCLVDMAVENYDRWYIVGHSLGSVIAFKGIMSPGTDLARYMNLNRWGSRDLREFVSTEIGAADYPDEPKCPHWLERTASLDRNKLFSQLRGFVTYGSPLEIFAHLWPAIVQINEQKVFGEDFEWLNFYDPTDIVARRPLRSFASAEAISPIDFACASSPSVLHAHTRYLRAGHRKALALPALIEWIVEQPASLEAGGRFAEVASRGGLLPLSGPEIKWRRLLVAPQFTLFLAAGLLFWPLALAYIGRFLDGLASFVSSAWMTPERAQMLTKFGDLLRVDISSFYPHQVVQELYWVIPGITVMVLLPSVVHYVVDLYLDREHNPGWWKPASLASGGLAAVCGVMLSVIALTFHTPMASPSESATIDNPETRTAQFMESIRARPPLLRAFLHDMPKGGDIHTHLSGAVYAENYIAWAADQGLCIEAVTSKVVNPPCDKTTRPAADALTDAGYYARIVDAWPTRNFVPGAISGHTNSLVRSENLVRFQVCVPMTCWPKWRRMPPLSMSAILR